MEHGIGEKRGQRLCTCLSPVSKTTFSCIMWDFCARRNEQQLGV
jgi:hypothetical protein